MLLIIRWGIGRRPGDGRSDRVRVDWSMTKVVGGGFNFWIPAGHDDIDDSPIIRRGKCDDNGRERSSAIAL